MKSDGQQKQPLIPPQEYEWQRGGGEDGGRCCEERQEGREKQENSGTRQRAARQAVGLTQQGGSFNKHELEPGAIECYNRKLMQMRADLMKKRGGVGWLKGGGFKCL